MAQRPWPQTPLLAPKTHVHRAVCNQNSNVLSLKSSPRWNRRFTSSAKETCTPSTTVSDETIAELASRPLHPLTLADLVRHGRPPLSQSALQASANFSLSILPTRLAHRIQSLRNLPFIVVTNPHIAQIHNNYMHSLSTLLPFAEREISTSRDEDAFVDLMAGLVQTHANTIPILARGFLESRKYIHPAVTTRFLDEHLRTRIGTRLIAEQHLALYYSSQQPRQPQSQSSYIGIIDTALQPSSIISTCESHVSDICELNYGVRPSLIITGDPDARIAHVPVHLEYIVTELLKNAFRATVEAGNEREPVEVTIAPAPEDDGFATADGDSSTSVSLKRQGEPSNPQDVSSAGPIAASDAYTPGVTIRLRDRGGGISPENHANLWNYGFTTFDDREAARSSSGSEALNVISGAGTGVGAAGGANSGVGGSSLAGLGYGLPLARAYAEYFGGGIAVQSLWSWGTDVYLTLRGVGRAR